MSIHVNSGQNSKKLIILDIYARIFTYVYYCMNTVNDLNIRTTITLSKQNYEKLKSMGSMGESFDLVIGRLLEQVKEDED